MDAARAEQISKYLSLRILFSFELQNDSFLDRVVLYDEKWIWKQIALREEVGARWSIS